jgi:hypothetical protein
MKPEFNKPDRSGSFWHQKNEMLILHFIAKTIAESRTVLSQAPQNLLSLNIAFLKSLSKR